MSWSSQLDMNHKTKSPQEESVLDDGRSVSVAGPTINFIYLFSSPFKNERGALFPYLNSVGETSSLATHLEWCSKEFNRHIVFKSVVANMRNSLRSLDTCPDILYLASHCDVDGNTVYMENDFGEMKQWDRRLMSDFFRLSDGKGRIKCAIVGACYSENIGQMLMEIGQVEHVVAVLKSVTDIAVEKFVTEFSKELLYGRTVADAFERSSQALEDSKDTDLFVLLPGRDHKVTLFSPTVDSSPRRFGSFVNLTKEYQLYCRGVPPRFILREPRPGESSIDQIYDALARLPRLLAVIQCSKGFGSTTSLLQLLRHLAPRHKFRFIFYVPMGSFSNDGKEENFVNCIVNYLSSDYPWMSACRDRTLKSLIKVISDKLEERQTRVLFLLDNFDQFDSRVVVSFLIRFPQLSVLLTVQTPKSFDVYDGSVSFRIFKLGPMTNEEMAKLILYDPSRKILPVEILGEERATILRNNGSTTTSGIIREMAGTFARSPIVAALGGLPRAAQMFKGKIDFEQPLSNHAHYVPIAQECALKAKQFNEVVDDLRGQEITSLTSPTSQTSDTSSPTSPSSTPNYVSTPSRLDSQRWYKSITQPATTPTTPGKTRTNGTTEASSESETGKLSELFSRELNLCSHSDRVPEEPSTEGVNSPCSHPPPPPPSSSPPPSPPPSPPVESQESSHSPETEILAEENCKS